MPLTKAHIADAVYGQLRFSRKKSVEVIEQMLNIMKSAVQKGDDILISGFGKFSINEKKMRKGRNPATGEDLYLSARRVVTFRCSGKLRKKLNKKEAYRVSAA